MIKYIIMVLLLSSCAAPYNIDRPDSMIDEFNQVIIDGFDIDTTVYKPFLL